MARVLVSQRLFSDAIAVLEGAGIEVDVHDDDQPMPVEQLTQRLSGYDALVCLLTDGITADVLRPNAQLKVVANVAVGYDNVDVRTAEELGIVVTNTPDVLTETTADLTLALMLAAARRIPEADTFARSGKWGSWQLVPEQIGVDVHGKTLGILGYGRIGRAVAQRASLGFGMEIIYHGRRPAAEEDTEPFGATFVDMQQLLSRSDFLSIHAPLTPETRHVIGRDELRRMRRDAILINTSRGPLVDEAALAEALHEGAILGAGLDVFESEPTIHPDLLRLSERVVLCPHLGSATMETRRRMALIACENVRSVLRGDAPLTPVQSR